MADHSAQVDTKYSINAGTVAPGMILEFAYTKIDKKGKQSSGKYMIVATSDFVKRPQDTVKMLHGVTLDVVSKGGLEQLAKNTGARCYNCDATNPKNVKDLFLQVTNDLDVPDIVVYNPSYRVRGALIDLKPEDVYQALTTNAFGAFLIATGLSIFNSNLPFANTVGSTSRIVD